MVHVPSVIGNGPHAIKLWDFCLEILKLSIRWSKPLKNRVFTYGAVVGKWVFKAWGIIYPKSVLRNITYGKFNQIDLRKITCNLIGFILSSRTHFQVSIFKVLASWKCSQVIRFIRFDYRFSNWSFWELNLRLKKNALIFHSRLKIFKSAITTSRTTPSTD